MFEAKYEACERLKAEGRLDAFRSLQKKLRREICERKKEAGETLRDTRTEAFYAALKHFPPLK